MADADSSSASSPSPSPRWGHFSASVDGDFYVWGGHPCTQGSKEVDTGSLHIFHQITESWDSKKLLPPTGKLPSLLYNGACAATPDHSLYLYGGENATESGVICLDAKSMEVSTVSSSAGDDSTPKRKSGCRMVVHGAKLVLFGGYRVPEGSSTQQGEECIKEWTNELHTFDIQNRECTGVTV